MRSWTGVKTLSWFLLLVASHHACADTQTANISVTGTVQGMVALYCPNVQSGPNPNNCGTVDFNQQAYKGDQLQETVNATVATTDPSKEAHLLVADQGGGSFVLSLNDSAISPTPQIPLYVMYTDCQGNTYGGSSSIIDNDIHASSIVGANPACTGYADPAGSGHHGVLTFTIPASAQLPISGNYSETLNITVSST